MEPFIGEIRSFGFNYAPAGWAFCQGQLLQIRQYTALFSILGTTYGGNGTTTFGLPNLSGAVPLGAGTLPGGNNYVIGETAGIESVILNIGTLPAHTHVLSGAAPVSNANETANAYPGSSSGRAAMKFANNPLPAQNTSLGPSALAIAGSPNPTAIPFMQPYLVVNYCIALSGVFPSRN